jgi:hypothetical protein
MTAVCTSYICVAPEGLNLWLQNAGLIATGVAIVAFVWFNIWKTKYEKLRREGRA